MAKKNQDLEKIQEETKQTEDNLKKKKRERAVKKKTNEPKIQERLVAPVLLLITILISYLIYLFS